jgi:hypothetical protein
MFGEMSLHRSDSLRRRLRLENLEARVTPAAPVYSVGAGAGFFPLVNVYFDDGSPFRQFNAYNAAFRGGVRVATADINGDGVNDTITAPGFGGGPHIRVFDGVTSNVIREFMAYDPNFFGGVFVAAGDVNRDGRADIITGAGVGGGPHVKVFNGANNGLLLEYLAYDPAFRGGVSVAAGDMNRDNFAEIITGAGVGGGPHVKVLSPNPNAFGFIADFFAFDPATRFGVNVASMPTGVFGSNSLITSLGQGGPPEVRIFNNQFAPITSFLAADPNFRGGINVGSVNVNFGVNTILTGLGPGGQSRVNLYVLGFTANLQSSVLAFDPGFLGGVYVG